MDGDEGGRKKEGVLELGSRQKGIERDRENGRVRGRRREMERSDGEKDGV